jgi:hypothetical protein
LQGEQAEQGGGHDARDEADGVFADAHEFVDKNTRSSLAVGRLNDF